MWLDIKDFEGIYQVSNCGIIRNIAKGKGRTLKELKTYVNSNGYECVDLYKNSKATKCRIHRLVLSTFKGDSNLEVNHIDGNKLNNNLSNLEFTTHSENNKHAFKIGLRSHKGENHNRAKLTQFQVEEIRELYKLKVHTQKQLAEMYGVTKYNICDLINYRSYK